LSNCSQTAVISKVKINNSFGMFIVLSNKISLMGLIIGFLLVHYMTSNRKIVCGKSIMVLYLRFSAVSAGIYHITIPLGSLLTGVYSRESNREKFSVYSVVLYINTSENRRNK